MKFLRPVSQRMVRLMTMVFLAFTALSAAYAFYLGNAYAASPERKGQKVIDFEDSVVEGVNKRPLDSLSQIGDANKRRKKPHLYRKRGGFRTEVSEMLRVMKYTP